MGVSDPVIEAVQLYLRGHAGDPGYRERLREVRLWIDKEMADLYAASPLWAGQPPERSREVQVEAQA